MEVNELIKLKKQELAKLREDFFFKTRQLEEELRNLFEKRNLKLT